MATKRDSEGGDVFHQNRIIYFTGGFSEMKVQDTVKKLLEFEVSEPKKDILIILDTNGGYVDSFLAIHDTIQMITSDVATLCLGKAMSCGALLLMAGAKGKRFITKNSRVMLHEISAGTIGKLSDMDIALKEAQRMQEIIDGMMLAYTDVKKEEIRDFMAKDTYCDAERAKNLGIVDCVVESYGELFGKLNI